MSEKFEFFWGGYCSQWAPSPMNIGRLKFTCAEQWMMYNKAHIFNDTETAVLIMQTSEPKEQKRLGRDVANFDDDIWMESAYDIVVQGNRAKFSQNPVFHQYLKDTGQKIIVEASPYDRRWGIGLGEMNPDRFDPSNWKGENLLGKAIMQVREEMFGIEPFPLYE